MNDITGMRSGRLKAIRPTKKRSAKGGVLWECLCDCGNRCYVDAYSIKANKTKSCGCILREKTIQRNKAGAKYPQEERESRLYRIWQGMYIRTTYPSQKSYKDYGGRGIKVCEEWKNDFYVFKEWALNNGYNDNLTIERIDNNQNYCPENCKWIPREEQSRNQRSNIILEYNGETHIAAEWANIMGIKHSTIYKRISKGKPIEEILKEYIKNSNGILE